MRHHTSPSIGRFGALLIALVAYCNFAAHAQDTINLPVNQSGGVAPKIAAVKVTSAYTVRANDDSTVLADPTAGAFTVTLPAPVQGRVVTVKNIGDGTYGVTLDPPGTVTIDGSTTYTVSGAKKSVTVQCYVVAATRAYTWHVISQTPGPFVQARTATTTGATTGTISEDATQVTVTADDSAKIIIRPSPVVGKMIVIHNGATAYKLRTSAPSTIAINGGSGANYQSTIAANSTCVLTCVTTTAWKGYFMDADSDVAKIPAAAP
ncbi:MAG: hypothetical protein ACOYMN_18445 [Roseimicrobium sp.]